MNKVSIIIPAHNEERVISRLLSRLTSDSQPGEIEVLVIANGCTDSTLEIAGSFDGPVVALSIPDASKAMALAAGNKAASHFPRLYVDADIELGIEDVRALAAALQEPGILAAAPERHLDLTGCSWPVRWYFHVWSQLPQVEEGLFGRGVIAVNEEGYARIADLPPVLSDDLAASLSFSATERARVRDARVTVRPARKFMDLLRVRIRVATGVTEVEHTEAAPTSSARTRLSDLISIARHEPGSTPKVALFLAVALLARLQASRAVRRGDFSTWHRAESSRV